MDLHLKPISREGIPEAISKAELYRNLNEPGEAESICRDILAADAENQTAFRLLGLSTTNTSAFTTPGFFMSGKRKLNWPPGVRRIRSRHCSRKPSPTLKRRKRSGRTEMTTQFCVGTGAYAFCRAGQSPIGKD